MALFESTEMTDTELIDYAWGELHRIKPDPRKFPIFRIPAPIETIGLAPIDFVPVARTRFKIVEFEYNFTDRVWRHRGVSYF